VLVASADKERFEATRAAVAKAQSQLRAMMDVVAATETSVKNCKAAGTHPCGHGTSETSTPVALMYGDVAVTAAIEQPAPFSDREAAVATVAVLLDAIATKKRQVSECVAMGESSGCRPPVHPPSVLYCFRWSLLLIHVVTSHWQVRNTLPCCPTMLTRSTTSQVL
jgi:hypothetical protein